MKAAPSRHIRVAVQRVAYDLVLTATNDAGVSKLVGAGALVDPSDPTVVVEELGTVDITFWGSTPAQLRMRAKTLPEAWPDRFERVTGDHFGVSSAGEHRFDVFLAADRFLRLLDLAHGSRRAVITLRCDREGDVDLVREVEISASRG
jgi:hypothetical protein